MHSLQCVNFHFILGHFWVKNFLLETFCAKFIWARILIRKVVSGSGQKIVRIRNTAVPAHTVWLIWNQVQYHIFFLTFYTYMTTVTNYPLTKSCNLQLYRYSRSKNVKYSNCNLWFAPSWTHLREILGQILNVCIHKHW
jgi:hypothetical protein